MINKRNLIVLTGMLSILLAACSNKPSYSDEDQVTPTVTVAVTPNDSPGNNEPTGTEEFGTYRIPEGDGDVETPKGSGDFFEITTYDARNQEKYIFKVTIYSETSPEDEERIWNEIKSLKGVEITQKAWVGNQLLQLQAYASDIDPMVIEIGQKEYPQYGTGEVEELLIDVITYEDCDTFLLYQTPNYFTGNELDEIRYNGESVLNYRTGDIIKLIGIYPVSLTDSNPKEINKSVVIDDYISGDIWWMNRYANVGAVSLIVPFEFYEEMVTGTFYEPKKAEYFVKCAEGYGDEVNQEMTEILGNYGRVEPLAGFVNCDWPVVE